MKGYQLALLAERRGDKKIGGAFLEEGKETCKMIRVTIPLRRPLRKGLWADKLLRRHAPEDYIREWEEYITGEKEAELPSTLIPVVIFRMGEEYLALPTIAIGQITEMKSIHRIPHQRGKILKGLVNMNGQLRLFVSLASLLQLGDVFKGVEMHQSHTLLMIEEEGEVWVFAVSEVCGLHHCDLARLKNVPVTVSKSTANYLKGVFTWAEKSVGLLEEELLFFSLRRAIL